MQQTDIIDFFTGKKMKLIEKELELNGVLGKYLLKVDTTDDDEDYNYLMLTHDLNEMGMMTVNNFIVVGLIKKIKK